MILLNSIWLFGLVALSIPVAIHLWNIRPGKTLRVGSVSLIRASSQTSRSFKLHDLLLLLLRCLLLALAAFVLAIPIWERHINSTRLKGWVLIPKAHIAECYQKFKPEIDSLIRSGYEFHYFDKGFQKTEFKDALANSGVTKIDSVNSVSYWSLIQKLDGLVPASLPLYLFTQNQGSHFAGVRPQSSLKLHWKTYSPADSTSTWIEKAWLTSNNELQVVQGNSKPTGTYYTNFNIRSGSQQNSPFIINTGSGGMTISIKKSGHSIIVDTTTWRFAIYCDRNKPDAGYVKAALESIIHFTKHKAIIKQYVDLQKITPHEDWVFWLSEEPLRDEFVKKYDNTFIYEHIGPERKMKDIHSWINDNNETLSSQSVPIYRIIIGAGNTNKVLWQDGFGNPVLSSETRERNHVYHFFSRFDPAYNDLVWSDNFPKMLLRLIAGESSKPDSGYDRRLIDAKQLLPATDEAQNPPDKITDRINLNPYCWLLLVLVFFAERWVTHKKQSKLVLNNG